MRHKTVKRSINRQQTARTRSVTRKGRVRIESTVAGRPDQASPLALPQDAAAMHALALTHPTQPWN